jgi:Type IV secretion-system coupling protein DNA-binding domain
VTGSLVAWHQTPALREHIAALLRQFPDSKGFLNRFIDQLDALCDKHNVVRPALSISRELIFAAESLYSAEHLNIPPPVFSSTLVGTLRGAQYRDELLAIQRKVSSPELVLDMLCVTLNHSFLGFIQHLPLLAYTTEEDSHTTVALYDMINVAQAISDLIAPFMNEGQKTFNLFVALRDQLQKNQLAASKNNPKKLVAPEDYGGTPRQKVHAYLKHTPLEDIFSARIPFIIPEETRFSGQWIVAPPGRGKTTLLHSMFLEDIQRQASIIVMDSKGDLINPIKELKAVEDRLVLIEPDAQFPLALNPLDVQSANVPHAIALIEYILSGLLDAKFTNLQSALFRHVLPAILQAIQSPTIETLKLVLANGLTPEQTANLDERLRQFFADKINGFYSKTYAETRSQIIWRLDFILTNDTMRTMFASPTTRLRMADAMNSGKVIIIDASKAVLGDDGSEFYQRFFLALILGAAQARSALNPAQKLPVFCYLDECQWVRNDQKLATILDECRSQRIALILAHQRTEQITNPNVLSAMSNCAIRFANSDDEAKFLAPKLRCEPEFLYSLPRGTFAAYVRDLTTTALALKIPYHDMRALPRMTPAEQSALRDKMRAQYSSQKVRPAARLEPQRSKADYQRLFDEDRERVSVTPEAPKSAPIRKAVAPVADAHPDAAEDTEAGNDW